MIRYGLVGLACAISLLAAPALSQPAQPPRKPMSSLSPQRDALQLVSGERVVLIRTADGRFEIKSEELVQINDKGVFTAVGAPEGQAPPRPGPNEIVLSFAGSQATGMRLMSESGLDYPYRFHAVMAVRDQDGKTVTRPTSLCPVRPKVLSMENWPHPIFFMVLANFEQTTADDGACKQ
jgi:hypothetical protein